MTFEDVRWPGSPLVHLRKDRGGAYCGEMCFGFGARATSNPSEATCGMCKTQHRISQMRFNILPAELVTPTGHWASSACIGEKCSCGELGYHKVEETIQDDDPTPERHPLTTYLCCDCFRRVMGRCL